VPGFKQGHIDRAFAAARNPQLRMKLQNMPVLLEPETVERYMRSILEAARDGNLAAIRNVG
jgi:alcohol dehydrogenase